jgi:hypothetical protein
MDARAEWSKIEKAMADALSRSLARRPIRGGSDLPLAEQPRDGRGDWICPRCERPIRPGESIVRRDDQIVHVDCALEACDAAAGD